MHCTRVAADDLGEGDDGDSLGCEDDAGEVLVDGVFLEEDVDECIHLKIRD